MMSLPSELLSLQMWFGSRIVRPLSKEGKMLQVPFEESARWILPSNSLTPEKRLEIYNQQYWWRLLSILQENFPSLIRIFGYTDFNEQIAVPFLEKHPPTHWSLVRLGDRLVEWLDEEYIKRDRDLVLALAALDWSYQEVFFAPASLPLAVDVDLLKKSIRISPHVRLFRLPFDLFSFRTDLVHHDVEYWQEADFPVLAKDRDYCFILYRNQESTLSYCEIQEGEWALLDGIDRGLTLEDSCNVLEKKGGTLAMQAQSSLVSWIHEWFDRGVLCF